MTDALALLEERLHAAGKKVKRSGDKLSAQCPVHPDRQPSLSATYGTQRDLVIYCHAGCKPDEIMRALDLAWTDLGDHNPRDAAHEPEWVYRDEQGRPLYKVVKHAGKQFRQYRMNTSTGEYEPGLSGVTTVPYRLPEVLAAVANGAPIWIAEGEKDVDALVTKGLCATCNSGGANGFKEHHAQWFRGASEITVVADRDDAGIIHAHEVARLLAGAGVATRIVQAREGKDAYDHLAFGHAVVDFVPYDAPDNNPTAVEWPDPIPIGDGGDRPPFPVEALPSIVADHAIQVADEMQFPVDLPAMLALTALSIATHGRVVVAIQGTWVEPLNTYLVTAMPPSAGKSPAFKAMLKPVYEWETELVEAAVPQRDVVETKRKILEKSKSRAIDKGETAEALALGDELRDLPEIPIPRLMADDVTPEKIPSMLAEQSGRLALVSTEGGVFQMMTGRYTDKSNLDVYLKSWSGDMLRVDRIGRGETLVKDPALSIGLTVQPDVIRALSDNPELRGRGLTARFMYSMPPDTVGMRDMLRASTFSHAVAERYRQHILEIARSTPEGTTLRLSDEARLEFFRWRQGHEQRLGRGGELRVMAEWVTKMQSTVARVAGLLHLADRRSTHEEIKPTTMQRAMAIGDYWEAHARLAHDLWGADPVTMKARAILDWIASERVETFTMRDAYRACRASIPRAADAVEPLTLLLDNGWIGADEGVVRVGRRGEPGQVFTVHPRLTTLRQPSCPHGSHGVKALKNDLTYSSSPYGEVPPQGHAGHGDMTTVREISTTPPNYDPTDDEF